MADQDVFGVKSEDLREVMRGSLFTRVDHIGIAVRSVERWIPYYRDTLGFELVGDENAEEPGTRLVYLDAGNTFIQLVEPVSESATIREWIDQHGEGIHHICLVTEDLAQAAEFGPVTTPIFRAGRNRNACFLSGAPDGVNIEVTESHPSR